jgi:hypothetical protein
MKHIYDDDNDGKKDYYLQTLALKHKIKLHHGLSPPQCLILGRFLKILVLFNREIC